MEKASKPRRQKAKKRLYPKGELNRLVGGMNPLETLMKLRGCVEFRNKEKMLMEINALRAERRL